MPAKKKATRKRAASKKARKIYYCVPCGMEITVSRAGIGTSSLMCCGEPMKAKGK